jgi:hypothetical protein
VRGEQPDRLAPVGARCDRVGGQVLAEHVIQEHLGAGAGQPVHEPGRRVEQDHDRVQVAVSRLRAPLPGPATLAAGLDRGASGAQGVPAVGQPARAPDLPEDLLGVGPGRGGGLAGDRDEPGQALRGCGPAPLHNVQSGRVPHRVDQQLTGRPPVPRGQRERPQALAQPPLGQRIGTPERRVQQRDRGLLVEDVGLERTAQEQQQGRDGRLQVQRQILGMGDGRHPGGGEGTLDRGQLQGRGPQQDRHPRPRHAMQ